MQRDLPCRTLVPCSVPVYHGDEFVHASASRAQIQSGATVHVLQKLLGGMPASAPRCVRACSLARICCSLLCVRVYRSAGPFRCCALSVHRVSPAPARRFFGPHFLSFCRGGWRQEFSDVSGAQDQNACQQQDAFIGSPAHHGHVVKRYWCVLQRLVR